MIYFLECREASAVKIGYARSSLTKRIEELQCGCPFVLELRGALNGDRKVEARIHSAVGTSGGGFRGEWFRSPHALAFLNMAEVKGLDTALQVYDARAEARRIAIQANVASFMESLTARGFTDHCDFLNAALRDPALQAELHEFADRCKPEIPIMRKSAASVTRAIA